MIALLLAFSPFITSALTGLVKGLPPFASLSYSSRPTIVRLIAALIAVGYMLLSFYVTGNLDSTAFGIAVQTALFALLTWLGSLGVFHAFFQKA